MDVVTHMRAEKGLSGLYIGMTPTLAREMAGNAIMFGAYEYLKRQLASAQVGGFPGQSACGCEWCLLSDVCTRPF